MDLNKKLEEVIENGEVSDTTTEENNLRARNKVLEELLERIDRYLDKHQQIESNSPCHLSIKVTTGKTKWGEHCQSKWLHDRLLQIEYLSETPDNSETVGEFAYKLARILHPELYGEDKTG